MIIGILNFHGRLEITQALGFVITNNLGLCNGKPERTYKLMTKCPQNIFDFFSSYVRIFSKFFLYLYNIIIHILAEPYSYLCGPLGGIHTLSVINVAVLNICGIKRLRY